MTADTFSEDIKKSLDSGMNAHTSKPVNLDELLSLLKNIFYRMEISEGAGFFSGALWYYCCIIFFNSSISFF